jgi:hypothetical protein
MHFEDRISRWPAEVYLNGILRFSPYRKENTKRHDYKAQLVNSAREKSCCLVWKSY